VPSQHGEHFERLAIIRYNDVSVEYFRGLSKRQIIGYLLEVPTVFHLLHPDALEQESLSCHLHTHIGHIPVAWDNFCLPSFKVASLVQVSQQAESEFHEFNRKRKPLRVPVLIDRDAYNVFKAYYVPDKRACVPYREGGPHRL